MKIRGKKMIMIFTISLAAFSSIMYIPPCKAYAMENGSEAIMPMADKLVWRYKTVNGIMYKRLYNGSTKQWVGNWIRCK